MVMASDLNAMAMACPSSLSSRPYLGLNLASLSRLCSRNPASSLSRRCNAPSRPLIVTAGNMDSNLEAKMNMKAYRREAMQQRRAYEIEEEEAAKVDLDPEKLLQPGDPDTVQATIYKTIPVGYFLTLPNGKDAYLPARELGTSGGILLLQKIFKPGQVLTVRVVRMGGGGRAIVAIRKDTPVMLHEKPLGGDGGGRTMRRR